jgi:hypothetical protein
MVFNLCADSSETEIHSTKKRKNVGRPRKPYSLSKHPYEKENELETFTLEIAGRKEEALLLLQKVQQKLSSDQLSSNRFSEKIAKKPSVYFQTIPFSRSLPFCIGKSYLLRLNALQEVKDLTKKQHHLGK